MKLSREAPSGANGSASLTIALFLLGVSNSFGATSSAFTASPKSLSFGNVTVGSNSAPQQVVIYNNGQSRLVITSIVATGDFTSSDDCAGLVAPRTSCIVSVQFDPASAGLTKQNLIVSTSTGSGTTPTAIALTGTGIAEPIVVFSRSALTFSPLILGNSSNSQIVAVRNVGSGPLVISKIRVTGAFTQTNACGSTLSAGNACSIQVSFAPTTLGLQKGNLQVIDNAVGSPHTLPLAGTAIAATEILNITPTALMFGQQTIGETPARQVLSLVNNGNSPVVFGSMTAAGDFSQSSDCPAKLDPEQNCSVTVTFTPTVVGNRAGTLSIPQAGANPLINSVNLAGTGVGTPRINLSALSLSFPNQDVGVAGTPKTITLTNGGTADLLINALGINGDFTQTNDCGSVVAHGTSCTIRLCFQPNTPGLLHGNLVIDDNAAGSKHQVTLEGTGSNITAIWANEGGDKVSQDELRASRGVENLTGTVLNRAWNGRTITMSGARNESVSFNMVLEAANVAARNVSVSFNTLVGPNGATIQTDRQATGNDVFNWVNRPIELFYVRYLQIAGLSTFGWFRGSDTLMPLRFQSPVTHLWTDRPDHNKFYPDILVPLELVSTFNIAAATNQSVWSDIYIPKGTPAGVYSGTVTVKENGVTTHAVPVSLTVQPFSLPDTSSIKGFSHLDANEIQRRYIAEGYINWSDTRSIRLRHIADVYFQLFHRHRIDLIGGDSETPPFAGIHPFFQQRYNGSLFTAANGYDGPGVGVGNTLYAVGPYGTWGPKPTDQQGMWNYADPIATWFQNNMPNVQYFIYLQDEPGTGDFAQVENWAKWLAADPGPGHNLLSMATVSMKNTIEHIPDLQIPTDADDIGECPSSAPWWCDNVEYTYSIASQLSALPNRHMWHYGGGHPGAGTTNTEDEGVAMRTWPWVQFKLGIERWFSWYANLNSPEIDVFQQAATWGYDGHPDPNWGQVSDHAYTNGNGILVYPGNDINHPANSYGVDGPFASLRLKEWRRGTEDGDYLTIANAIDPVATSTIVHKTIPFALWENKAPGWPQADPSYFYGQQSWSSNPDDWELARAELAQLIATYCASNTSEGACK